jgi:nicotinamidase-related amidase
MIVAQQVASSLLGLTGAVPGTIRAPCTLSIMAQRHSLHGNAPDDAPVAMLVIDMINDLQFEGGARLLPHALRAAKRIALLKSRARAAGVPVIYANDNFGRWRSDFRQAVHHCLHGGVRGQPLVAILVPDENDYFVLKPKHSGFYATTLSTLLDYLGAKKLILTGVNGDTCVLATAMDAFLRDFQLHVPRDCVASVSPAHNRAALAYMKRVLRAETQNSGEIDLRALARHGRPAARPASRN